jgi:outer membrane protein OmpA-like peptidoglycan-associated protein
MNTRTFIRMPLFLAVSLCFLGCGHMKRPPELLRLDELAKDQAAMTKAKGAAPTQFAAGQEFQKKAENAFTDDEAQPCVLYSTLALTKYNSALEQAKSKVAKERQTKATQRLDTAKKRQAEQEVRRADYDKRITRMEKILALQTRLDAAAQQSAKEKKVISDELTKAKSEGVLEEMISKASSQIQAAETLEANKTDPTNLNSAKTYVEQARKAIAEARYANAKDLAKLAVEKATLAVNAAQSEVSKKSQEFDMLRERATLFNEALGIDGIEVKQERRGLVLTLRDMFTAKKVTLETTKSTLLDKIAELAKKYAGYSILVEGYTDSAGRRESNLALSQSRAQSVIDYLIQQHQIKLDRIQSSGYGADKPVSDNSNPAGRAQNRRIEVVFLFR